ncbi:hypothetical protein NDU88_000988 [Pleurodeles waltl]|uniref:Reverse transcriptase zinc-binding domain-containing protein n=1 Tax=Pleurodeles waltl TaxID=8319 RepID=A0AAV7VZS1_PLEWA|nr:hypothetical protein NDU88_000988 [Pleurodeles waltl]
MHKMGLIEDACCIRCAVPCADFMHRVWNCLGVPHFWNTVFDMLEEITGYSPECSPLTVLLGYVKDVPQDMRNLIALLLLLAKHQETMYWGWRLMPRRAGWLRDAAYCQEQLTAYWQLIPARSSPKYIGSPLEMYLSAWAREVKPAAAMGHGVTDPPDPPAAGVQAL